MGNGHPLSLKLKRNMNWSTQIYSFNKRNIYRNKEIIINKILLHKLKNELVSKPQYISIGGRVEIVLLIYKRKEIKKIKELENYITKILKKEVKIKIKYIKNPILNSNIFGKYLSKKLKRNSFRKIRKEIRKMIKIPKEKNEYNYSYNWIKIYKNYMCKKFISYIIGIYMILKGRISKERRAKRSMKYELKIGRLKFNYIKSLIDYSCEEEIEKNGVYSIKICTNTDIRISKGI